MILSHTNSQKNEADGTQSERTLEPKGVSNKNQQPRLGSELSDRDDEVAQLNRKVQMREAQSERNPSVAHPKDIGLNSNIYNSQEPHRGVGSGADALPGAVDAQLINVETN